VVVVVDHFCPGGGKEEEVGDVGGVVVRGGGVGDAGSLEDEGIETAEETVVGVGHFGGAVEGGVAVLEGVSWVVREGGRKIEENGVYGSSVVVVRNTLLDRADLPVQL